MSEISTPWAVGCYTSQVRIKQRHRALNALYATEKMASVAAIQGFLPYPKAELAKHSGSALL